MDDQTLRAAMPAIAPDDALLVICIPREAENRPHRNLGFYQVSRETVWNGVGQGQPLPIYLPPPPPVPVPPAPPLPPVPLSKYMQIKSDFQNARLGPGLSYAVNMELQKGVRLGVNYEGRKKGGDYNWVQVLECDVREAVGCWVAWELLGNPT